MSDREPVLLSWSGGKDSALTLMTLKEDPAVHVVGLLTTVTEGYDRIAMHGVRRALLERQAATLGLPVTQVLLRPGGSNAEYEAAMGAAFAAAKNDGVRTIAFGDLHLADVRAYREQQLAAAGMTPRFPVWGRDTKAFFDDVIALGFKAVVVCVDTEQLDPTFLGRDLDETFRADLPDSVDPCGENGEFHTFVWDCPLFTEPLPVTRGEIRREERFHFADLLPA